MRKQRRRTRRRKPRSLPFFRPLAERLEARNLLAASLSISDPAPVDEGTTIEFEVTLTGAAPEGGVEIQYTTVDGNAQGAPLGEEQIGKDDYTSKTGIVTFATGESGTKLILIDVVGDTVLEGDETFQVQFTSTVGDVTIINDSATGTIKNDDSDEEIRQILTAVEPGEVQSIIDTFAASFDTITEGIKDSIDGVSGVPVVGGQLDAAISPLLDTIEGAKNDLSDALNDLFTSGEDSIEIFQNTVFGILGPDGPFGPAGILQDGLDSGNDVSPSDILVSYGVDRDAGGTAIENTSWIQFDFHIGQRTLFPVPFEFDFGGISEAGLDALGLEVETEDDLRFDLRWDLRFGFGLSQDQATDENLDANSFFLNAGAVDITGTPVEEFLASISITSAPPKDEFGNDILTTDDGKVQPGVSAEANVGILNANLVDGIPFGVDITAPRGIDLADGTTPVDFTLLIDVGGGDPVTANISGFNLPETADEIPEFAFTLQQGLITELDGQFSNVETAGGNGSTTFVPVTVSLDFSRINGVANPDLPTTPSLVIGATLPQIGSMTIIGGEELGFFEDPLYTFQGEGGQSDDARSASLGFSALQTSSLTDPNNPNSAQRLIADSKAPAFGLLMQDTEFFLILNDGQGDLEKRVLISIGEEALRATTETLRDEVGKTSLESIVRDSVNTTINQQQDVYGSIQVEVDASGRFVFTSQAINGNPAPTLSIDFPSTDRSKISVAFTVDVDDPDWTLALQNANPNDQTFLNRLKRTEIQAAIQNDKVKERIKPEAEAKVALKLHATADFDSLIGENAPRMPFNTDVPDRFTFPNIEFDIIVEASAKEDFSDQTASDSGDSDSGDSSSDSSDGSDKVELNTLRFENVTIDGGALIESLIQPLAGTIAQLVGPLTSVVGAGLDAGDAILNQRNAILNAILGNNRDTLLELMGIDDEYERLEDVVEGLLGVVEGIQNLLDNYDGSPVALGCFEYVAAEEGDARALIPCSIASAIDSAKEISASQFIALYREYSNLSGGLSLDFLQPTNFVNLFSGNRADLVSFNLPQIGLNYDNSIGFNAVGASTNIDVNANANTRLGIVYDTTGLAKVNDAIRNDLPIDWNDLLDGLYIRNEANPDNGLAAELSIGASVDGKLSVEGGIEVAGVGVTASATLKWKLDGGAYLDVKDPNRDGRLRLNEIEALLSNGNDDDFQVDRLLCLFDVSAGFDGEITAKAEAPGVSISSGEILDLLGLGNFATPSVDINRSDIFGVFGYNNRDCGSFEPILAGIVEQDGESILRLHTGPYAADRVFVDTSDGPGEGPANYTVTQLSDGRMEVSAFGYTQTYSPRESSTFKKVVGIGDVNNDSFDLSGVGVSVEIDARGGNDFIAGGRVGDVLIGGPGDDSIDPLGGDDIVITGTGRNTVFSSDGSDTIDASGNDAGANNAGFRYAGTNIGDTVIGSPFNDVIAGSVVFGADGDDSLIAFGFGGLLIDGGGGNDDLVIELGREIINPATDAPYGAPRLDAACGRIRGEGEGLNPCLRVDRCDQRRRVRRGESCG